MTWFQRLLLVTIGLTFVLVVIGGTVRATDSGLGCPDWPTCHGRLIPRAEKHTLIEFSHRTAASVVGVVFLGVTFFAFKSERRNPLVFWLAFSAGLLLVAQIILGGITVKRELPPEIVAAHLATAMAFMGVLIVTATVSLMRARGYQARGDPRISGISRIGLEGRDGRGRPIDGRSDGRGRPSYTFTRLAVVTAAAAFATLVLGSYISGTNASLACDGWPLCNGSLAPGGGADVGLHYMHRLVAAVLGLLMLATIWAAFDERRGRLLAWGSVAAGVLYITQALVGAANIWTELAAGVVIAHLSLAALLWCVMVAIVALSYYLPDEAELRGVEPVERGAGRRSRAESARRGSENAG